MATFDPRPLAPVNDIDLLNAIREIGTNDYQRRVPEATKANIRDTVSKLWNYRPARNEFVDALVNRIGLVYFQRLNWTNPMGKYKRGALEYGDTIEEIYTGLIQAKTYDPQRENLEREIFGQHRPEVQSSFHRVNRQDYYPLTVNNDLLRRAFTGGTSLFDFTAQLMDAPAKSDQWDEFLAMMRLFREYYDLDGFFKIQVPDVTGLDSTTAEAKTLLRRIRETAGVLPYISRKYNAAHMPVAAEPDELILFITPEANAAMDVEALAAAFNIDRANVPYRVEVIPGEHFNIPGMQAILTTKDFFVVADNLFDTQSIANPVSVHQNYFLHHWQIISVSRFVPAILFTTEAGTVYLEEETPVTGITDFTVTDMDGDAVTVTAGAVTLERGSRYALTVTAETTPDGGVNDGTRLDLFGATSPFTYVTQTGVLNIARDEESATLVVVASSTGDPLMAEELTVTLSGAIASQWPVEIDTDADGTPDDEDSAPSDPAIQ